jgi:hypothetical protein
MPEPYPVLRDFLGGWFHQDFDLEGDVPDIVPRYAGTVSPAERAALAAEIRRFLAEHPAEKAADAAFRRLFRPDIDPAGWNLTTRGWLGWVLDLLDTP